MRVRLVGVAMLLAGMVSTAPARAATISFDSQTVALGDTLRVDIYGTDLSDVAAFGFDLGFDTSILAFTDALEGTFLSKAGPTQFAFCPDGSPDCPAEFSPPSIFSFLVQGTASSTAPQQPELLATLVFLVIGAGDAQLVLGSRLLDGSLNDILLITETPGTITSVPEPSTLALLGVGLAAVARKRLKRKALG